MEWLVDYWDFHIVDYCYSIDLHFRWALMALLGLGIIVIIIGKRFRPEKEIIGGFTTMRDLIIGIQGQINKTAT